NEVGVGGTFTTVESRDRLSQCLAPNREDPCNDPRAGDAENGTTDEGNTTAPDASVEDPGECYIADDNMRECTEAERHGMTEEEWAVKKQRDEYIARRSSEYEALGVTAAGARAVATVEWDGGLMSHFPIVGDLIKAKADGEVSGSGEHVKDFLNKY